MWSKDYSWGFFDSDEDLGVKRPQTVHARTPLAHHSTEAYLGGPLAVIQRMGLWPSSTMLVAIKFLVCWACGRDRVDGPVAVVLALKFLEAWSHMATEVKGSFGMMCP